MDTGQEKSIVDRLLSADNEEECSLARYAVCAALEDASVKAANPAFVARESVFEQDRQAPSDPS